jgi:hypothetical protein
MHRASDLRGGDRRAIQRRASHRDGEGGIEQRDSLDRRDLHLDDARVLDCIRDLEDPRRPGCVGEAEVAVALADQELGRRPQSVPCASDLLGVVDAERGRRSVENVGGCHRPRS